jgi:hypothetical protein
VLAVLAVFAAALLGRGVAAAKLLELVHAFDCSRGGRRASRGVLGSGCWVFWVLVVQSCARLGIFVH